MEADYLLTVKSNQETLHADVQLLFQRIDSTTLPIIAEEEKVVGKGHGRVETRIYSVCHEVDLLRSGVEWNSLKCIGKARTIREWEGKVSDETRYFISS